jgi:hypothetical protein
MTDYDESGKPRRNACTRPSSGPSGHLLPLAWEKEFAGTGSRSLACHGALLGMECSSQWFGHGPWHVVTMRVGHATLVMRIACTSFLSDASGRAWPGRGGRQPDSRTGEGRHQLPT